MVKVQMNLRPLRRSLAKSLKEMVGVARIELATPAMSTRWPYTHPLIFRAIACQACRIWSHLFSFESRPRFNLNFGPLCILPLLAREDH